MSEKKGKVVKPQFPDGHPSTGKNTDGSVREKK